jgi:hypothetical protein
MTGFDKADVPIPMRNLYRLEHRRSKRQRRKRLSESVRVAGELAREHGVNPVSRALRLEFNRLKPMSPAARGRGHQTRRRRPSWNLRRQRTKVLGLTFTRAPREPCGRESP